jgi:hypothetical protein
MHCMTNIQGRKWSSCNMTTHDATVLTCAWRGFRTGGNFCSSHPTLQT